MKLILLFFFLIINLLFLLKTINSQDIKLGGSCELIDENSKCASKLNYTYFYLQPGDSLTELYKNVSNTIDTLELTNADCKSNATYVFCLKSLPKCNTFEEKLIDNSNKSFNFPSLPCNSICMKAQTPCQYYIDNFFKELSCGSKFSNGQLMFPIDSTEFNITDIGNQQFNFTVQCSDTVIYSNETVEITCPKPLLSAKKYVKEGKSLYYHISDDCILGCPFDIYPSNKMDRLYKTNYVLTSISFITCTFMILTFGLLPNKITHRMESILSFSIGGFIASLSLFIQSSDSDFSCSNSDPGRFKSQSDNLCLLTGLIFQFGALTLILWSPMIAYDFYLTSVMKKITKFGRYRIVLWGICIVLTALPAFGGKYGATLASNCWITSQNNSVWQYISFFIPSWISMAILVFFSIFSVINVSKMYMQTPNNRILFFNIKIAFTIVLFLFDLTFASSLKFYMEERMDSYFDAIAQWAICISSNLDPDSCELNAPGYDLKALNIVVIAILGFTVFIGYGLDPISVQIWKESTKLRWFLHKCKLEKVIDVLGKTGNSGNISTSTTGSDHDQEHKRKQTNIGMSKITVGNDEKNND